MKFDFKDFQKILNKEIIRIYLELEKIEKIDYFAIYTDTGAMSLVVSANTKNYLKELIKNEPDESCYYTWVADEWKYNYIESETLDKLSSLLAEYVLEESTRNFDEYFQNLIKVCMKSLKSLRLKNNATSEDLILLFTVSDYDSSNKKLEWIKELNNSATVNKYMYCADEL